MAVAEQWKLLQSGKRERRGNGERDDKQAPRGVTDASTIGDMVKAKITEFFPAAALEGHFAERLWAALLSNGSKMPVDVCNDDRETSLHKAARGRCTLPFIGLQLRQVSANREPQMLRPLGPGPASTAKDR